MKQHGRAHVDLQNLKNPGRAIEDQANESSDSTVDSGQASGHSVVSLSRAPGSLKEIKHVDIRGRFVAKAHSCMSKKLSWKIPDTRTRT